MDLEIFSRDIVPIIGLASLIAVYWQLNRSNRWNKLNFTYTILNSGKLSELSTQVINKFSESDIDIVQLGELTGKELTIIKSNQSLNRAIFDYLNFLEYFCIGIKNDAVEASVAFDAMAAEVCESWKRYKVFIAWHREEGEDVYSELEKYSKKWKAKLDAQ